MRRTGLLVLALAFMLVGCGKKQDVGADGWPKSMKVIVDPADGNIRSGKFAEISLVNNTGENFTFDWVTSGNCFGKLTRKSDEPFAAKFLGGKVGQDCTEEVKITLRGESGTYTRTVFITTQGNPAFGLLELRPDPIPESWVFVNDYEKTLEPKDVECKRTVKRPVVKEGPAEEGAKPEFEEVQETELVEGVRYNMSGGLFDTWGYEFGTCTFVDAPEGDSGVLALEYYLPQLNSYCGFFEQFKTGEDCEAVPFDISGYEKVSFLLKSADDKDHFPVFEIVGWDQFTKVHQGAIEPTKALLAKAGVWTRYEIEISKLIRDVNVIDPAKVKSIGFRVNRKAKLQDGTEVFNDGQGKILVDNLVLIKKAAN